VNRENVEELRLAIFLILWRRHPDLNRGITVLQPIEDAEQGIAGYNNKKGKRDGSIFPRRERLLWLNEEVKKK